MTTYEADGSSPTVTYANVAARADRLAAGLQAIGTKPGDRVGTYCWSHADHLSAYFGVACMGAVLHAINIRLFPEQAAFVINHAGDRLVIVDDSLAAQLAASADLLEDVERFIVVGGDGSALGPCGSAGGRAGSGGFRAGLARARREFDDRSSRAPGRKMMIPERWAEVDEIPKTSVGKADKRDLRALCAAGEIEVASLV